jgi:hypothetical protein
MAVQSQLGPARVYYVVHPLDDEPEEKRDVEALGPMHLTPSVKYSLFALRTYLILMVALAAFRVLSLAGVFGPLLH